MADQPVISVGQTSFSFLHKIDMYGTFFLVWMIWEVPYMTGAFYDEHAIVKVPFEMLLHGPIILNPVADLRSEARLACNPHFQIFLGTPAFLTDDFMGTVLTKARSNGFLAVPDVHYTLLDLRNHTKQTQIHLALRLHEVCELTYPEGKIGGCIKYDKIFETCLDSSCGDRVFLCWWQSVQVIEIVLFVHVALFVPGVLIMILTMFDPPPMGFLLLARPFLVGMFYCASSTLAFLYISLTLALIWNYLDQPVFFATYASQDNLYGYEFGQAFIFTFMGACVNFAFGCGYLYVSFFTPAYPRHPSRLEQRRGYFNKQLAVFEYRMSGLA